MTHTQYKEWRLASNLTQEELAARLQIDVRTVRARETGENPVSYEAAVALRHVTSQRYVGPDGLRAPAGSAPTPRGTKGRPAAASPA